VVTSSFNVSEYEMHLRNAKSTIQSERVLIHMSTSRSEYAYVSYKKCKMLLMPPSLPSSVRPIVVPMPLVNPHVTPGVGEGVRWADVSGRPSRDHRCRGLVVRGLCPKRCTGNLGPLKDVVVRCAPEEVTDDVVCGVGASLILLTRVGGL
jgi:hypothetical protein